VSGTVLAAINAQLVCVDVQKEGLFGGVQGAGEDHCSYTMQA